MSAPSPALKIQGLQKTYSGVDGSSSAGVNIKNFEMDGEVALHGPSGSGKTTFLHLVAGILRPDNGRVWIAGDEITSLSESGRDRLRAQKIGIVYQAFHLLHGFSALENVALGMAFGRGVNLDRARMLLKRVGLKDRMNHRPDQLSIGQQQRVAVARALANSPQLVLADEPTGNLDPERARESIALLKEICREAGAALLVVSHDPAVLASFDRRVELSELSK